MNKLDRKNLVFSFSNEPSVADIITLDYQVSSVKCEVANENNLIRIGPAKELFGMPDKLICSGVLMIVIALVSAYIVYKTSENNFNNTKFLVATIIFSGIGILVLWLILVAINRGLPRMPFNIWINKKTKEISADGIEFVVKFKKINKFIELKTHYADYDEGLTDCRLRILTFDEDKSKWDVWCLGVNLDQRKIRNYFREFATMNNITYQRVDQESKNEGKSV